MNISQEFKKCELIIGIVTQFQWWCRQNNLIIIEINGGDVRRNVVFIFRYLIYR